MIVEHLLRIALLGSAWVMYLLLALSVVSIGATIERIWFFRRHRDDIEGLKRKVHEALASDDLFEAEAVLVRSPSLEARVVRSGLRWIDGGPEVFNEVVASEMERVRHELERGMTLLGTLGNNAPFVGLLGTVIGVIEAFHQLGDQSNKNAMGNVMAGIAEALVATAVGLFVAIPAVVSFNWAQKKVGDIESNVSSMTRLVAAILRFRERENQAGQQGHEGHAMPGASYNRELGQAGPNGGVPHVVVDVPAAPRVPDLRGDVIEVLPPARETRDLHETRDPREAREPRDPRDSRESASFEAVS